MIQNGIIIKNNNPEYTIQLDKNICGACNNKHCSVKKETAILNILSEKEYKINDKIKIFIPDNFTLKGNLFIYFFPILILVSSILIIYYFTKKDILSIFCSFIFLVIYFFILHKFDKNNFQKKIKILD